MADILTTLFTVSGQQALITATNQVAAAQLRLNTTQTAAANAFGTPGFAGAAQKARTALTAFNSAQVQAANSMVIAAAREVGIITAIGYAASLSADKLVKFGSAVMNIRDLTGASARDSVRAENLFRVSGVGDSQQLRDIMRLGKSAFSEQGQSALSELGVGISNNGLTMLDNIIDRLHGVQDGLRKTELEEQIFGARGVAAIQPLLRLTKEQRDATNALSDSFDTNMLPSIQNFQATLALTGQEILQKFVFPLAQAAMPVIITLTGWLADAANAFNVMNNFMGGTLGAIVGIVGAITALGRVIQVFLLLEKAVELFNVQLGIMDALSGNWGALAAAAGIAIGGGIIYHQLTGDSNDSVNKNVEALDANTAQLARLGDSFGSINGNGSRPNSLTQTDISTIWRQGRMSSIG